ncbi:MAG: hypothetical protein ACYTGF_10070 [Planctomycetota bacterium]|jgi:hypothetical protein
MRSKTLTVAVCASALFLLAGSSYAAPCPCDINNDGIVGINDFLLVLADWGAGPSSKCDVNHDQVVNILDVLELLANWGPCP